MSQLPPHHAAPAALGWEVPAHTQQVFSPRHRRYALVIPVINEGERIRRQLQAVAAAAPAVDVIIADGGSTDGSMEPGWLAQNGVTALLVKTGPGRLSAQLRMAYAWCLTEGYEGIVTIDGNGKDGVDAIARFVDALDAGYDYVQGSRYRPGGKAVNTPLDRKLAGRLIHAPVLSLAGRRWYTDTTNGFRGYSRRYLADPRVAPFRDAFSSYELLFYLTVRAGQLGFRTCELPVTRIYPPTGKTPTKIAGFSGRLAMLGEVMRVALGRYAPG
jgi:glycosyltransferase involved in cell wall biosynthesis